MYLYRCRGCDEEIQAGKPRVRCQQCEDYDICANCVLLATAAGGHQADHRTVLHRASGVAASASPPRALGANGWGVLIEHDTFATLEPFDELMEVIFRCLDSERLGYLSPEAFSAFCDLVDIPSADNVWKRTMESGPGREHEADVALRRFMEGLCIDHVLRPRATTTAAGRVTSLGLMPLVTLEGLSVVYLIEFLTRPDRACDRVNVVLQNYQPPAWRARGDLPRAALPPRPDRAFVEQYAEARARLAAQTAREDQRAAVFRQPAPTGPATAPGGMADVEEEEARLRKAEEELEEMQRDMERDLEKMRMDEEIRYIEPQKINYAPNLESIERGMEIMRGVGQDRYYRKHYYYE